MADKQLRNWKDFFWPLGGTLFGLLVMPITIAEYPQFFNENEWILPISVIAVLVCWVIPLALHDRSRRIYSSITSIPRFGHFLFVLICLTAGLSLYFGGTRLFRYPPEAFARYRGGR